MMFSRKAGWGLVVAFLFSTLANAQRTTATIAWRVTDPQDAVAPGVVVTVESPNLQGVRSAVTSVTGDYLLTNLPSGSYTVTFELDGFEKLQRHVSLAP